MESTRFVPETLDRRTTNYTTIQPMSVGFAYTLICFLIVTFIVGFIGNGIVIFLTGCRMKTTVNSIWFLNLAIADFIFILSFTIAFIFYFLLHRAINVIHAFFVVIKLNRFASIFFLVVISLDRCLCTWMVVWAHNNRTVFRAKIICMIVWVLSIGCCIPSIILNAFFARFLVKYNFLVGFLIPFLIIASSYIAIGVRIKCLKMGKQLRSYRVIIVVILAFFICCFPYYVCGLFEERNEKAMTFTAYLLFLNSSLNPILYVFMCDEYKKKLKQSLPLVLETAFAEDHLDFIGRQI